MKKIIAILTAVLMLVSFSACNNGAENTETTTKDGVTDAIGNGATEEKETETFVDENGETVVADTTAVSEEATTEIEVTMPSDAPSEWTTEQIVEFYKAAAIKSKTKVKSKEMKELKEMVVNDGDGLLGTLVEWATPFLVSALEDSEVEFDGITGGYENLVATDVANAKAYKSGEYIVVEMTMKPQTDGIHGDRYGGTVGHAISVVGDISSVAEALPMFAIDFENADIKLHYTKPVLKVKINKDGIIEKGTWSYSINITVANLHVAAVRLPIEAMVESAHGSVDYLITVGGGF